MLSKNTLRARALGWALLLAGCGTLIGVDDSRVQGACSTDNECAPGHGCLLERCRNQCASDAECGAGSRCLRYGVTSACIPGDEGCGAGCPDGTTCVGTACRTGCSADSDCAGGQACVQVGEAGGICVGTDAGHDTFEGVGGAGPTTPMSEGGSASMAGGGTSGIDEPPVSEGGAAGAAGDPPQTCTPHEPLCDGNRATTCNDAGTGFASDGTDCSETQTCVSGSCEDHECPVGAKFCSAGSVRQCAEDGLSSEEVEPCGQGKYCDAASAACKQGLCAPSEPACDGARATTCNAEGSGYEAGGTECGGETTCDAGDCKEWVCPKPGERYCLGQDVKSCAPNGLSSEVEATCEDQACIEATGTASCQGVCEPGKKKCSGSGVQTCDSKGQWGAAVACQGGYCNGAGICGVCGSGDKQCSGSGVQTCSATGSWGAASPCAGGYCNGAGVCGVCASGSKQCSNNGVQTCSGLGAWGNAVACAEDRTCVDGSCAGVCGPGQSQNCGNCNAGTQSCNASGAWGSCQNNPGAPVTYYRDVDGDNYGNPNSSVVSCTGAPPTYVTNNTDCCDTDANAKPNSGTTSSSPRNGCGGYDYNCDGSSTTTNQPVLACSSSGACTATKSGVSSSSTCGASVPFYTKCYNYYAGGMAYCTTDTGSSSGNVESKCH